MNQTPKTDAELPRKKVQRYSPDRLLRQKLVVRGPSIVSTEKHRGRIVVRVESEVDNPGDSPCPGERESGNLQFDA